VKARALPVIAAIWLWLKAAASNTATLLGDALEAHAPAIPAPIPNPSAVVPIDPAPEAPATAKETPTMGIIATLEQDAITVLKQAGIAIEQFVLSEGQKVVATLKETPLGTDAENLISALMNSAVSGSAKMASVVAALVPLTEDLVASGSISGLVNTVEDTVRELAQSIYNDFVAAAAKAADAAAAKVVAVAQPAAQATESALQPV
jgi:hypothetical protein